ncbi:50S ribosomal protein L35 [Candidatus Peregrinibacteria bacterium]|nr:50S ribosomal protein L35 [Candidatus Peregrinibacteria bacterium]
MKQKTHSGMKKRVKIRKSGKVMFQKSAKKHLLADKSKKAKKKNPFGLPASRTQIRILSKLIPGKIKVSTKKSARRKESVDFSQD